MKRVYTIWPTDRHGTPATTALEWLQTRRWCVIDISDGWGAARIVTGPVDRSTALRHEQELRAIDHAARRERNNRSVP